MAWPLIGARGAFVLLAVFTLLASFSLLFRFDLDLATLASHAHICHCSSSSPLGSSDREETVMPWAYNLHPMVFQRLPEFDRLPSGPNSSADPTMTISSPLEEKPPARVKEFLRVTGDERWYGVSMLHQLHCLRMLQSILFHENVHSHHHRSRRSILEERGDDPMAMDESHWTHCLSYIAQQSAVFMYEKICRLNDNNHAFQAIICAADDTLESTSIHTADTGERMTIVNGLGGLHQCRDASFIREAVLQSQTSPVESWDFKNGDTLTSVLLRT